MFSKTLPVLALLSSTAFALDFTQWAPAGPGDVRSPCPALNSLANHGFIDHSGKGITVPELTKALGQAFNLDTTLSTVLSVGGLLTSPNKFEGTLDLDNLDKHNIIEHDASLTRYDYFQTDANGVTGDDHTFQPELFAKYMSHFTNSSYTTLQAAATAKFARVTNSSQSDPKFTYGPSQFLASYGETTLYMLVLGGGSTDAPVKYLSPFFAEERLPYNEGWRTPNSSITFSIVNSYLPKLIKAGGEAYPEGLIIGKNTLAMVLLGLPTAVAEIPSGIEQLLAHFGAML